MPPEGTISEVLGGCPELALFEAFALRKDRPLTPAEASRFANVAWATAHRRIQDWRMLGVLEPVGKEGKATKYQLNLASPSVWALTRAVNVAARELAEAEMREVGFSREELTAPTLESKGVSSPIFWNNTAFAKQSFVKSARFVGIGEEPCAYHSSP